MISESIVIGTLIYGNENLKHIPLTTVKPYHFSGTYTRIIYEGCIESEERFGNISEETVADLLDGDIEREFIKDYKVHTASKLKEIEGHCEKIADEYTQKSIMTGLESIVFDKEEYESSRELITDVESITSTAAIDVGMPGLTYSEMIERDKNKPRYEKLDFGDPFWNQTFFKNCGGHKGQMLTIFGDSKHGKSITAMMFSRLLIENGYSGLYTSFEDIDRKYAEHVRAGLQNKDLIDNLYITDHSQGCSNLDDIVTTTKYHKATNDISFLVVDNAQIVDVEGVSPWDEKKKLVTISPALSRLAIELDIWVVLLSQISNERAKQNSGYKKQPKIHDVYGSGQIRKDSYMAISTFKPSEVDELLVYNDHTGDVRGVKHPSDNGEIWPTERVLVKQELIREGEKYWKSVRLDISDNGLFRPNTGKRMDTTPF